VRTSGVVFTSSWDLGTTFNVYGDGSVKAFPDENVTMEKL